MSRWLLLFDFHQVRRFFPKVSFPTAILHCNECTVLSFHEENMEWNVFNINLLEYSLVFIVCGMHYGKFPGNDMRIGSFLKTRPYVRVYVWSVLVIFTIVIQNYVFDDDARVLITRNSHPTLMAIKEKMYVIITFEDFTTLDKRVLNTLTYFPKN